MLVSGVNVLVHRAWQKSCSIVGNYKTPAYETGSKIYQQVNVSSPVALLKPKKPSFIPVNQLSGTNSLVQVSSQ